jgi:HSP20 family protein
VIRERRSSSFSRCFKLPEGVDAEKIKAEFTSGVLTLSIPKSEAAQPKKIEVEAK